MLPEKAWKIGVFDSGLGGLSILKEFIRVLPEYDYVYLGDNARVPYGGRSPELIYQFTTKALDYLFSQDCGLVILACNTATSTSLKRIQQEYLPQKYPERKVLGIIKPVVEQVVVDKVKSVGVLGTYATINSKSFVRELKKGLPKIRVYQVACPLFVPLIEEGDYRWLSLRFFMSKYLESLKKRKVQKIILGCTHYGLISHSLQKYFGKKTLILSEGKVAAQKLKLYLEKCLKFQKTLSQKGSRTFYVTDLNTRYEKMFRLFLGKHFPNGHRLQLVTL